MYRYISILSLDVVTGACICSLFVADFFGVEPNWMSIGCLGISVWVIYTFDHLNDARNIGHIASTERHRFHQRHFRLLSFLCILMLLVVACLIFMIPVLTLLWGAALSILVLAYFILLYWLKLRSSYHKEITIAIIYSAGILLPVLSVAEGSFGLRASIIFIQFFLLALTNLMVFSIYEFEGDQRDNSPSLVRIMGMENADIFMRVLISVQVVLGIGLCTWRALVPLQIVLLIMVMLTGSLLLFKKAYHRHDLYRFVGDAVFMIPVVTLL